MHFRQAWLSYEVRCEAFQISLALQSVGSKGNSSHRGDSLSQMKDTIDSLEVVKS